MMNWIAMGGYGVFVWSAIGITIAMLLGLHVMASLAFKQQKKTLSNTPKTRSAQTQVHVSETKP